MLPLPRYQPHLDLNRGSLSRSLNRSGRLLLLSAFLLLPPAAHPQGCTQCRDNAAATPPSTQRAYRHAISLLALTAGGIFLGTVVLLRRQR